MPTALSCNFNLDRKKKELDTFREIIDLWYEQRKYWVAHNKRVFDNWWLENDFLYRLVPNNLLDPICENGEEWMFVMPCNKRNRGINKAHKKTVFAHLWVEKTYERVVLGCGTTSQALSKSGACASVIKSPKP